MEAGAAETGPVVERPNLRDAVRVRAADYNGHRGCDHANKKCTAWDGSPFSSAPDWLLKAYDDGAMRDHSRGGTDYAQWDITTARGVKTARPGDWIVRRSDGDLDVCEAELAEAVRAVGY